MEERGFSLPWLAAQRFSSRLHGAAVRCTDLRGGAAIAAAALAAEGETTLAQIEHIDRGYEALEENLRRIGADARREEAP